jgi:tetratricopeptide (TPR) repeat protein
VVGSQPLGSGAGQAQQFGIPAPANGAGPSVGFPRSYIQAPPEPASDPRLAKADSLIKAGKPADGLALAEKVLCDRPNDVLATFTAAAALLDLKKPALAYHLFRSNHYLDRANPNIWANLGHCLADMDHAQAALEWFQKAHNALKGESAHWSNMASVFAQLGRPDAAVEAGEKSLEIDQDNLDARYNLSLPYLSLRRWPEGWRCYDEVIGRDKLRPNNDYSQDGRPLPWWDGLGGNPVVFGEQGLGDAIMFASMVPDAVATAEKVILDVDLRLFDLFKRSFPEAIVASTSGGMNLRVPVKPTHRMAMGSLGNLFRQNDADFPGMPFLTADPERVLQWRVVLNRFQGPYIGISWKGGTMKSGGRSRSMDLMEMLPLFQALPGATFVALNYQPETGEEIAAFEAETGHVIKHWSRATRMGANYDDTAGLVDALDAVVSVQQSAVHLAGALGKPTWVFVPDHPQWRYGVKGDQMPWYGSVKIVRQDGKVWMDAVARSANEVEAFFDAAKV